MNFYCNITIALCIASLTESFCFTEEAKTLPLNSAKLTEQVDIGQNRKIHLECQGIGSPVVIFISGRGNSSDIWKKTEAGDPKLNVFDQVSKITRVCAYDRPGTFTFPDKESVVAGLSTPFSRSVTPKDGVADLHAALLAAKVPSPYVLVAHSYGGLIARLYASTYPNEVAGLVLVDTLTEYLVDFLSPKDQAVWMRITDNYSAELDRITLQERIDLIPSFEQLRQAALPKAMPVVVLASDKTYDMKALIEQGALPKDSPIDFGDVIFQTHLKGQKKLAQVYNAKLIADTHAGHYIQTEQPGMVVDAIREVVERVRRE